MGVHKQSDAYDHLGHNIINFHAFINIYDDYATYHITSVGKAIYYKWSMMANLYTYVTYSFW